MKRRRRFTSFLRKGGGIIISVVGITLIVKTLPYYLWSLLLGLFLIWIGWWIYALNSG